MKKFLHKYRLELLLLLLAAVLRVGAIAVYGEFERPQLYEYGGIARHILAGKGYAHVFPILHPDYGIAPQTWDDAVPTAFTMPGYTLVMTAALGVLGDNSRAYATLYALNLIVSLLSLFLLYILAVKLLSIPAARFALFLAAVFPPLVAATATFGGTVWTHAVMLGALVAVERGERGKEKGRNGAAFSALPSSRVATRDEGASRVSRDGKSTRLFLYAGLLTGVWILFRGEALGAAVLIALWMWRKKDGSLRNAAVYLAAALILVLPWSVRNTMAFDRVVPLTTNFWLNAWRGNHAGTTGGAFRSEGGSNWLSPEIEREIRALAPSHDYELRVMDLYRERTIEFVTSHPLDAAVLYVKKLGLFLTIDWSDPRARHPLFLYPQLLLIAAALIGAMRLARRRRFPVPLGIVVLVTGLSVAALHVETRYVLMMGILYIVLAAAAIHESITHVRE